MFAKLIFISYLERDIRVQQLIKIKKIGEKKKRKEKLKISKSYVGIIQE